MSKRQHLGEWAPHCASRADPILGLGVVELKTRKLLTAAVDGLAVSLLGQFTLMVLRRESWQAHQPSTPWAQNEGYILVQTSIHLKYELWSMWRGWTCRSKAAGSQRQKATTPRCPRGPCIKLEADINGLKLDQRLITMSAQKKDLWTKGILWDSPYHTTVSMLFSFLFFLYVRLFCF